jgi:glycosyltransferase involved in cell wall biosynthesis
MVQQVLQGLGGDARQRPEAREADFACYHVNCRVSRGLEDVGRFQWLKPALLVRYLAEALWCRWRHGATDFFCVPASPNRSAIYRDWIVMVLARLCFRRRIYYWQAAGLAAWLATQARGTERWLTRRLLGRPEISIVLSPFGRADAEALGSRRIEVIPNFVSDPCPDYDRRVAPHRHERRTRRGAQAARKEAEPGSSPQSEPCLAVLRVLFMALGTRTKGLFDAVEAVALANRRWQDEGWPARVHLEVAGGFSNHAEQREFEGRIQQPDLRRAPTGAAGSGSAAGQESASWVQHHGFVGGEAKRELFQAVDGFCLPTYYPAEGVPLVLVEAMAYGLPLVVTRWRSLPELLPPNYPGLVDLRSPEQIAAVFARWLQGQEGPPLRPWYEQHYQAERCLAQMREVLTR